MVKQPLNKSKLSAVRQRKRKASEAEANPARHMLKVRVIKLPRIDPALSSDDRQLPKNGNPSQNNFIDAGISSSDVPYVKNLERPIAEMASALNVSKETIELALADQGLVKLVEETWMTRDRNKPEKPTAFIRRVYARWLGKGLTRDLIRRQDFSLYKVLAKEKANGPLNLNLPEQPTKKKTRAKNLVP